ncbi:hypothetical protein ACFFWC_25230 [Plantactinospora siamensis]|uniref:Adhesin domain-containing protein n=1 Tax=Plantactinospora siamensis TaxID=555372 RepID=A0ABV6NW18_9ACTN
MGLRRRTAARSVSGGLAVLVGVLLAGCTGPDGRGGDGSGRNGSGPVDAGRLDDRTGRGAPAEPAPPSGRRVGSADARATALPSTPGPGGSGPAAGGNGPAAGGGPATGSGDGRRDATFDLADGADRIRVRADDIGADLYRLSTPDGSRVRPAATVDGGTVRARLVGTGLTGPANVDVVLNSGARWTVRLGGGAIEEVVDLSGGRAAGVDLVGGATRIEVALPRPDGTVTVRMSGGASEFVVRPAGGTPVRVRIGAGAGAVDVDGDTRSGVAAGTVFQEPAWDRSTDRVQVDAAGGVSTLTVRRG